MSILRFIQTSIVILTLLMFWGALLAISVTGQAFTVENLLRHMAHEGSVKTVFNLYLLVAVVCIGLQVVFNSTPRREPEIVYTDPGHQPPSRLDRLVYLLKHGKNLRPATEKPGSDT